MFGTDMPPSGKNPEGKSPAPNAFPIVGVGASAGGLEAFMQLLRALPADTGMAFVLVQHLDPKYDSKLADLLARSTKMPVVEAAQGVATQPNHVYVIAPDTTLSISAEGVLQIEPRGDRRGPHLPIDYFFKSLAARRGSAAIGVILSGTGSDGTVGLEEIKAGGGVTFAQDDASAKFSGMPVAALHSGCVDLVLPPDRIAAELARIGDHPYLTAATASDAFTVAASATNSNGEDSAGDDDGDDDDDDEGNDNNDEQQFKSVLGLLRAANGVDFSAYRDTTIKRRIKRRMLLDGGSSLSHYIIRLKDDRPELDALYQDILINVTKFFRDPDVFESLKRLVFPTILAAKSGDASIRVWVPGCSTGQEAYSLAIALLEFLDDKPVRPQICIFATDLSDRVSLRKARAGLYPDNIEAEVSAARLRRFFHKEEGHYRINKSLRDIVVFARQNVAADPSFSRVDLVSCRNLLIYLSPALQKRVIPTFHFALNPGGYLLLGSAETISAHTDLFSIVDQTHRIYARRSTGAARPYPHFRADEHRTRADAGLDASVPSRPTTIDWQREADRVAAGEYVPPGVLINDEFDILQFRGETGPFLAPASGDPSHNLLKMAREGLFMPVRAAVVECQRTGAPVRNPAVRLRSEGSDRNIDLRVMPVKVAPAGERCYLVLFEEQSIRPATALPTALLTDGEPVGAVDRTDGNQVTELHDLRKELATTREYLQALNEQHEAANEELKSANEEVISSNEELQSTNEELQSTNEELETAKEELQSINEELTTVNEQLQHRNVELARLNDETTNLLTSGGVAKVVVGIDLRIRRFTPAAAQLFGLVANDIDRPFGHFLTGIDLPDIAAMVAQVIDSVQVHERDVHGPDGRAYQLRIHPYRTADHRIDGAVLVLFDTDELRRAQSALKTERDSAQAIVDTVGQPLLVLDQQLKVVSANNAFYRAFQVNQADTQGRLLYDLGNGQWDIAVLRERLGEVLSRSRAVSEFEVTHRFESIGLKAMRLDARRILDQGTNTELILLAIEDRTNLVELEHQVQHNMARLIEDDRLKTAFLALLAHELRNPLAPIRNALHILDRVDGSPDTSRQMRGILDRQVQQLTRLVDDLLDVARINKGHIELRNARLDLVALVRDVTDVAQLSCTTKSISMEVNLPAGPMPLDADATRVSQMIGNLLINACKFTDPGGRITVRLKHDGDAAVVRVTDTGIGIAADQLPRIFDMFVQIDSSLERTRGGLGLGLTLVKRLAEAHGGTISVASAGIGLGSTFTLRLPLPNKTAPATTPDATTLLAPATNGQRRVLVVDDNHDGAESLSMALEFHGYEVRTAHDGPAALALADAWRPNVILLDIGLPGMNGYEVALRLGKQPWRRDVHLIAVTGWGQMEDRVRSVQAGFDAHLVKPVDLDMLIKLLVTPPRA